MVTEDLQQTTLKQSPTIRFRNYKNFNKDPFKTGINELDWPLVAENTDVNLGFETFLCFINIAFDKHVPFKTLQKKENKILNKPWVTKGIRISMKKRYKLYKQMIKTKNKQQNLKRLNPGSFIITHRTADETSDLISSLESSKSVGPYNIPTKIMKRAKGIISLPFSKLIINSISHGIFPNISGHIYF